MDRRQSMTSGPPGSQSGEIRDVDRPIFVVGCQRSGTTALTVMLDRHSRIAVPSETQYFCRFTVRDRAMASEMTHEGLLQRACDDFFIKQAGFTPDELRPYFTRQDATYGGLFHAMLECFVARRGKPRPAEKSCDHIYHLDEIFRLYPNAKVICILRDGRDVVRSLRSVPWGRDKRYAGLCRQWNRSVNEMLRAKERLSPDRFFVVRYEDLMTAPEPTLRALSEFIGEDFEPGQIEESKSSVAVPDAELKWKGKARGAPDAQRVAAWRQGSSAEEIAQMNFFMGRNLRRTGYPDTKAESGSLMQRLRWALAYAPFLPGVFPIAFRVNRALLRLVGRPKPDIYSVPDEA